MIRAVRKSCVDDYLWCLYNFYKNKGGSPGLVVVGGGSCSKGPGFESKHCLLDGHFSHLFVVKW